MKKLLPLLATVVLLGIGCVGKVKTAVQTAKEVKRVADDLEATSKRASQSEERDREERVSEKPKPKCPLPVEVVRQRCAIPEGVGLGVQGYQEKTGEVSGSLFGNTCGAVATASSTEQYSVPLRVGEPVLALSPASGPSWDFWKNYKITDEWLREQAIAKARSRSELYRADVKVTELAGIGDHAFIADTPLTVNKHKAGLNDPGFILWVRIGNQYGYLDSGGADYKTGIGSFLGGTTTYQSIGGGCSKEEVTAIARDVLVPRIQEAARDFEAEVAEWNAKDDAAMGRTVCTELKSSSGDPVFTTADAHDVFGQDWNYFRITALNPIGALFNVCEYMLVNGPFLSGAAEIHINAEQFQGTADEYLSKKRWRFSEEYPGVADRAGKIDYNRVLVIRGSTAVTAECYEFERCKKDDLKRIVEFIGRRLR